MPLQTQHIIASCVLLWGTTAWSQQQDTSASPALRLNPALNAATDLQMAEQLPEPAAEPLDPVTPIATELPSQNELVSVLKRQVPTNATIEAGDAPEWFQSMMLRIVRENVPNKYVNEKKWGKTDRRWDGLKVRREGLQIRTKRRWKEVNHGTWKRYEIQQIDPQNHLWMRIENVHDAGDGKIGFEVTLSSKLRTHARISQWAKGAQLASISADAGADVKVRIWCELGMRLDFQHFPPDFMLAPEIKQADITLLRFELDRVSKLDGPLVHQLGRSLHKILRDKIDEKKNDLPKKINRQIAKHEDKLRFSPKDFAASKWKSLIEQNSTQEAETAHAM